MKIRTGESTGRTECQFVIQPETSLEKIAVKQFLKAYRDRKNKMVIHGEGGDMAGNMSFNFGLSDHDHRYRKSFWYRIAQKIMNW